MRTALQAIPSLCWRERLMTSSVLAVVDVVALVFAFAQWLVSPSQGYAQMLKRLQGHDGVGQEAHQKPTQTALLSLSLSLLAS